MPADMNDYFKKKKPSGGGGNGGGDNNLKINRPNGGGNNPFGGKIVPILITAGLIGFAFLTFKPFTIINSGEVGIKVTTGKYETTPLQPGFHLYIPVIQ